MALKDLFNRAILIGTAGLAVNGAMGSEKPQTSKETMITQSMENPFDFFNQKGSSASMDAWHYDFKLDNGAQKRVPIASINADTLKAPHLDNIVNGWGQTLLTSAIMNGKTELVNLLLIDGANPTQPNILGQQPMMLAIMGLRHNDKNVETMKSLAKRMSKEELNQLNADGETFLMQAATTGNFDAMSVLIAAGARTDIKDKSGKTAMDHYKNVVELTEKGTKFRTIDPRIVGALQAQK